MSEMLKLDLIRLHRDTQPRAKIAKALIYEYGEAMKGGAEFPPITVFHDGEHYWLADGFHRYVAAVELGLSAMAADVRQGSQRDAVLFSVGANAVHGLRRSNVDKVRAIKTLLDDPEWSGWSNREIARRCAVSEFMVRKLRSLLSASKSQMTTTVRRGGSTYTMDTAGSGGCLHPVEALSWSYDVEGSTGRCGGCGETLPVPIELMRRVSNAMFIDLVRHAAEAGHDVEGLDPAELVYAAGRPRLSESEREEADPLDRAADGISEACAALLDSVATAASSLEAARRALLPDQWRAWLAAEFGGDAAAILAEPAEAPP
jgi:ParB-like nuclease domain